MGEVRWTEEATDWLREIHDHIASDSPRAALQTVRGIHDRVESLNRFPERGYRHTSKSGRPLRILLYGHYRIAYSVSAERDVIVLGVFHGALDIDRHLR